MEEINEEEYYWNFCLTHIQELGKASSSKHQASIKDLLDLHYDTEISITENPELTWIDVYDSFVVVCTTMVQMALRHERYEMIPMIDKAMELQSQIVRVYLQHGDFTSEERDELNEWLGINIRYYHETKSKRI